VTYYRNLTHAVSRFLLWIIPKIQILCGILYMQMLICNAKIRFWGTLHLLKDKISFTCTSEFWENKNFACLSYDTFMWPTHLRPKIHTTRSWQIYTLKITLPERYDEAEGDSDLLICPKSPHTNLNTFKQNGTMGHITVYS